MNLNKYKNNKILSNLDLSGITLVFGKRGGGKSTLVKNILEACDVYKILVWDFVLDYNNEEFYYKMTDMRQLKLLLGYNPKNFKVAFHAPVEKFNEFCDIIWRYAHNITLVIEEADQVMTPQFIDRRLNRLVQLGRHLNINIIIVCRRPAAISKQVTSQAARFLAFKTTEPVDLKYFKDVHHELPDILQTLNMYEYLYYSYGTEGE